jgi:oligopeptide/dipeptide ABC transporter ATP-binding protein
MLEVENLTVSYRTKDGRVRACEDVSFTIEDGSIVGLVGESGSGKSTVGEAILQLLPDNAEIESGSIRWNGQDLLELSRAELQSMRWDEFAVITQSSMNAFDPVYTVGNQIIEAIQAHRNLSDQAADERVVELFETVSLDPERRKDYPHQLSGGMTQRALIAMALALEPDLIIADEPTTALDVVTQDSILHELEHLQDELSNAMLLISHDIAVVSETSDEMMVMYAGEIVEAGGTQELLAEPYHPYTIGLKHAFPELGTSDELIWIPGSPPELAESPDACRFAPRCPFSTSECFSTYPPTVSVVEGHRSKCLRHDIVDEMRSRGGHTETWRETDDTEEVADDD